MAGHPRRGFPSGSSGGRNVNPTSYLSLPERFFSRVSPTRVAAPRIIKLNYALAAALDFDLSEMDTAAVAALFSGNALPPGSEPIALAYAGHQFGHFVPQLGDGRAILIGESRDRAGVARDIQLKGCGRTPYSRNGDGRAALGPVLREYVVSEAMHGLGIPTTRALAAVTTGEFVRREAAVPGGIVTRVAASHVRVGTFEFFAARGDVAAVRLLADYVIHRHYPACAQEGQPYLALLRQVISRQAALIAAWMNVGFVHGVMNTDNMAVSGETIDFGPCAFMEAYDPATVFSSIDERGRYAYGNQPHAAAWNLARFAETLLPLIDADSTRAIELATAALESFAAQSADCWLAGMRRKLGLSTPESGDQKLAEDLLSAMQQSQADFTLTFRALCEAASAAAGDLQKNTFLNDPGMAQDWLPRWRARLSREAVEPRVRLESMRRANPTLIPRNHRVEQMIVAAIEQSDFGPFERLLAALERPYEDRDAYADLTAAAQPSERVLRTFCGT
jgi:serine/tyrosine/threonine adenylyltransferase